MAKGIPAQWLKNISDKTKRDEAEAIIRNSTTALSRLYDLLEEKEQSINSQEASIADFDNPSWAFKSAFRNGQRASLKEIKELLTFIKGERLTDLFSSTTNGDAPVVDPSKNYLEELVGEGKKFKSQEDLARAKLESDAFIARLQGELQGIRTELNTRLTVEQMMDKITAAKEATNSNTNGNQPVVNGDSGAKSLTEEDLTALVEDRISKIEKARIQESNLNQVRQVLTEKFGADFPSHLKQTATNLGVGEEFLNNLAKEQPKAFLALVGQQDAPKAPQVQNTLFAPTPSQQIPKTPGFAPTGERKKSFYDDLKRKDAAAYWSPKVQNQMHQDAIKLGEVFFDSE